MDKALQYGGVQYFGMQRQISIKVTNVINILKRRSIKYVHA
jgi:hypothetical protein